LLDELRKDHIIIFVTHRLETARLLSDRIVVMEGGFIKAQGTHEQLMQTDNFYSEYWQSFMQ
jgi:ABC-type transport system involved in cytochrome bd biosynthesis, ATPase and permease components